MSLVRAISLRLILTCSYAVCFMKKVINIEPPWCHQTCALYHLQNNLSKQSSY